MCYDLSLHTVLRTRDLHISPHSRPPRAKGEPGCPRYGIAKAALRFVSGPLTGNGEFLEWRPVSRAARKVYCLPARVRHSPNQVRAMPESNGESLYAG